jgi:hypothetical protein
LLFSRPKANTVPLDSLRTKYWWTFAIAILFFGGILRLTGYNFQLPFRYNDHYDGALLYADSLKYRGVLNERPMYPGYPPGIHVINIAAQLIAEQVTGQSFWDSSATAVAIVRIWAALIGIVTALIAGLLVKALAGDRAALLTVAVWLALPGPNYHSVREMPMAWVLLFSTLSLYMAVLALQQARPVWAVLSVISGLASAAFRYSELILLGPAIFVTLWYIPLNWRKWIPTLIIQVGIIALGTIYVYLTYAHFMRAPGLNQIQNGLAEGIAWDDLRRVWEGAILQLGMFAPVFIIIVLIGITLYLRSLKTFKALVSWGFIAGYALLATTSVVFYLPPRYFSPLMGRYVTPASVPLTILACIALVWIIHKVSALTRPRLSVPFLILVTCCLWVVPLVLQSWQLVTERSRPDTHAGVMNWAVNNLGQGNILVDTENYQTFSKVYGAYPGPYRLFNQNDLEKHSLEDWVAQAVKYAVVSQPTVDKLHTSTPQYLDRMLILNRFPPTNATESWQGLPIYVFRLYNIQYPKEERFGENFVFKGYDLVDNKPSAGGKISLRLYWQSTYKPVDNYNIFIHLKPIQSDTILIAQLDGSPASGDRPTLTWVSPDELLISPTYELQIPEQINSGCYQLVLGLYNYRTGERLKLSNNQDNTTLMRFCTDI